MILWVLPSLAEEQHGLPVRGYGVMLFLGVTCGTALSVWRGHRAGLDPDMVMTLVFWGIIPGILGARTYYVVEYWDQFWAPGQPLQTLGDDRQHHQGRAGRLWLARRRARRLRRVHPEEEAPALGDPRFAGPRDGCWG